MRGWSAHFPGRGLHYIHGGEDSPPTTHSFTELADNVEAALRTGDSDLLSTRVPTREVVYELVRFNATSGEAHYQLREWRHEDDPRNHIHVQLGDNVFPAPVPSDWAVGWPDEDETIGCEPWELRGYVPDWAEPE